MSTMRKTAGGLLIKYLGLAYILYHVISAEFLVLPGLGSRFIHINGALLLAFLTLPTSNFFKNRKSFELVVNMFLSLGILASSVYIFIRSPELLSGTAGRYYPLGIAMGLFTIFLILEGNRRLLGWIIPVIVVVCLIYARFGEYFPLIVAHANFGAQRLTTLLYLGTDGIYGMICPGLVFLYLAVHYLRPVSSLLRGRGFPAGFFLCPIRSYQGGGRPRWPCWPVVCLEASAAARWPMWREPARSPSP